jgi:serine/threonine protein kinase
MQYLQPNITLQGGKYRIERVLGQGGFGITYLATQLSLQRQVAIKEFFMKDFCSRDEATQTMSTPSTGSRSLVEQYRKKFIKEARNLARLNHPHIISVIDVFEENDTVYYVMPYLSGGSLQDYVKTHGTLSEQEAMKYVKQIASALKYMHEDEHICHYDVKPANILLNDKGNAVLIDFGISKNYDAKGQETTTTPVGMSEGYAPIEQYQQNVEEFSPVSDVYALGATLYFLLHGRRPVSAVHRASGTSLLMSKQLSSGIKDIINASMKVSKRERAKSVDVFMGNIDTSSQRVYTSAQDEDERTIVESAPKTERSNTTYTQSKVSDSASNPTTTQGNNSAIGWIIGIAVIAIVGFFMFNNQGNDEAPSYPNPSNVESTPTATTQPQETTKDIYKERVDIYKERVEQFAEKQSGVIASFPNDKRYSVYYSKKDEYGRRFLFHYDAIADRSEKMNLPIEATTGEYTDLWVTKNRYIFVAAEYRYTDFIRIDTQTNQVKYITDCASVKRSSSGFTVVQSECINEYSATCEADKEYAYTDYYYNEEGINVGHGQQYR